MLTQDEVLEIIVDALQSHGPEDTRDKPRDEIMMELRSSMMAEDENGQRMIDFLMVTMHKAYNLGRESAITDMRSMTDQERMVMFKNYCLHLER